MQISDIDDAPDYAADYLRTYFLGDPTPDDRILMTFLAEEAAKLSEGCELLEIGCGPVVNHVLSAAVRVSHIDMADYREDNLAEIRKWVERLPKAHSWHRFTRFALAAEGRDASESEVRARESLVRERIRSLMTCDLRCEEPLGQPRTYAAVSCFYATEQAGRTREEWRTVFGNLSGLVSAGGRLFFCAIGYTDHYILYDEARRAIRFSTPRLEREDLVGALERNGFDMDASHVSYRPVDGQEAEGVHGVILVSAAKFNA